MQAIPPPTLEALLEDYQARGYAVRYVPEDPLTLIPPPEIVEGCGMAWVGATHSQVEMTPLPGGGAYYVREDECTVYVHEAGRELS